MQQIYYFNKGRKRRKGISPITIFLIAIAIFSVKYLVENKDDLAGVLETADTINDNISLDLYEKIETELGNYQTEITFSSMANEHDLDELANIFRSVVNEHPEYFWLTGGASWQCTSLGPMSTYQITAESICSINEAKTMSLQLESIVDYVVGEANKQCATDYEKALFAHDYLVLNCAYDESAIDSNFNAAITEATRISYTAYGALVNGKAVCDGYSKAYMILLSKLGIECGHISGRADNTLVIGDHAWNYIRLDDGYYFVDVTWDDPMGDGPNECYRTYFCVDKTTMEKNHWADDGEWVPEKTGVNYVGKCTDYYVANR